MNPYTLTQEELQIAVNAIQQQLQEQDIERGVITYTSHAIVALDATREIELLVQFEQPISTTFEPDTHYWYDITTGKMQVTDISEAWLYDGANSTELNKEQLTAALNTA